MLGLAMSWKPLPRTIHSTTRAHSQERLSTTGSGRFEDHEKARELGLPGAIVPGIMGMAFLTSMIHRWAPEGEVVKIDTVFRAPMLADKPLTISAIVTDIDEDEGLVELDLTIKNEADETRVLGTANVRLPTE